MSGITTEYTHNTPRIHRIQIQYILKIILSVKNEFPTHENIVLYIKQGLMESKLELLQSTTIIHPEYTGYRYNTFSKLF